MPIGLKLFNNYLNITDEIMELKESEEVNYLFCFSSQKSIESLKRRKDMSETAKIKRQNLLLEMNIVDLIGNILSDDICINIKEESLDLAIGLLNGGNHLAQGCFYNFIKKDIGNAFFISIVDLLESCFNEVTSAMNEINDVE